MTGGWHDRDPAWGPAEHEAITEGSRTESNLRDCRCGSQLWVAVALTPLVDAGTLVPQCWPCQNQLGTNPDHIIGIIY